MKYIKIVVGCVVNFILLAMFFSFLATAFWLVGSFVAWNWIEVGGEGFNVLVRLFVLVALILGAWVELNDQ